MRATLVMLATAGVLLVGLSGFAQPAAAEPAEPYRAAGCTIFGGDEVCIKSHGVVQVNETPSGNTQYHEFGELCYTITDTATGEVVDEGCEKDNEVYIAKDGQGQVFRKDEEEALDFTSGGTRYECTFREYFTAANGAYRNYHIQVKCDPPLPD